MYYSGVIGEYGEGVFIYISRKTTKRWLHRIRSHLDNNTYKTGVQSFGGEKGKERERASVIIKILPEKGKRDETLKL